VIEGLHEKYETEPKAIGLEAVFIGPNKLGSVRAAMALGQLESILDYEWPDAAQKVLTAAQWRKLCGIQQGGKQPVMEWALNFAGPHKSKLYKVADSQDTADAIAIAYATCQWSIEYGYEDND
jgi:Holliday junction resolvasome RuvABC endonuclease subunit